VDWRTIVEELFIKPTVVMVYLLCSFIRCMRTIYFGLCCNGLVSAVHSFVTVGLL
jgi:hypothetical protein